MKKQFLSLLLCCCMLTNAGAQEQYTIEGTMKPSPKDLVIHLYYTLPRQGLQRDSCGVTDGRFHFSGKVATPTLAFLIIPPDGQSIDEYVRQNFAVPKDQVGVYLEKGTIKVAINSKNLQGATVSGTANNQAAQDARPLILKYRKQEEELSKQSASVGDNTIPLAYTRMEEARNKDVGVFIKAHPQALASLDLLKRWVNPVQYPADGKLFFSYLSEDLQKKPVGLVYKDMLERSVKLDINAAAPDFTLPDTTGIEHNLSNYKGKYILLDFWASWCKPCRAEVPNLKKVYEEYQSKNFEIIAVSVDGGNGVEDPRTDWLTAIKKDGAMWVQLSDLKGIGSDIARLYMISFIPMNYLIDPNGKIIAKNLRGEALEAELKKYL